MNNIIEIFIGKKIKNTRMIPVTTKIIIIFVLFSLISSVATNFINLTFNQAELKRKARLILAKDLRDLNTFCLNQYEIYKHNQDLTGSILSIRTKCNAELKNEMAYAAEEGLKKEKTIYLGIQEDGICLFDVSKEKIPGERKTGTWKDSDEKNEKTFDYSGLVFPDKKVLDYMNKKMTGQDKNRFSGFVNFKLRNETGALANYLGYYKWNKQWQVYLLKGEEEKEFFASLRRTMAYTMIFVAAITILATIVGIWVMRHILQYVTRITGAIMAMTEKQELGLIDLGNASNDDITFLGVAFNSLAATIDTLLKIFRKFATKDVTEKAYREKAVRLEGSQQELTMLFTDIKGFTNMTEVLGTDIIVLLNMHYEKAIRKIFDHNGIIGSIIGDALLAVFGVWKGDAKYNKSYESVLAAYKIHEVAEEVRGIMHERKEAVLRERGSLTSNEERIFEAVLIQVGVGIDGGEVFYGNIGSSERMTSTVIGDNVNSASRLEGLTRIYKVPVIVSEYVKTDVTKNVKKHGIFFQELDMVQVKGKTIGKKVFWPIIQENYTPALKKELDLFDEGLKLYYSGTWAKAKTYFDKCSLPLADEFKIRTKGRCPKGWNGIWTMKTK